MENQKIRIVKKGIERKFNSKTAKHSTTQGCVVEACGELMYLNEIVIIPSFSGLEVVAHAIWVHPETGSALSLLLHLRDGDSLWAGEIVDGKGKKVFNIQIEKYL